jgi:spermidine synthase
LLAAVPSGLILSTTLHLTTDIVAMPLLWVAPLGAYLLSFTVAFASKRNAADAIRRAAPIVLLIAGCGLFVHGGALVFVFAAVAIVNLFTISVALHSRLFESRPEPRYLTLFYLTMSVGGALGGLFCALIAPLIFNWTYEHLLLLVVAACLLAAGNPFDRLARLWAADRRSRRLTLVGAPLLIAVAVLGSVVPALAVPIASKLILYGILAAGIAAIGNPPLFAAALTALLLYAGAWSQLELSVTPGKMTRSFFGVYAVRTDPGRRILYHGTTIHGIENIGSAARERMATTYYATRSGIGLAMTASPALFGDHARIGIVGLGTGTLACYARPGQQWTFYEIDPAIEGIATDPSRFAFLSRCLPHPNIVIGDARLTLEHSPPAGKELLVVDAFSSDAIPMHLLTREAFSVYGRNLTGSGLLMVHISNRYLDLEPVIAAAAAAGGWTAAVRYYVPSDASFQHNEAPSKWIALSRDPATMHKLVALSHQQWRPLRPRPGFGSWTDDYASLLPLIRWGGEDRG